MPLSKTTIQVTTVTPVEKIPIFLVDIIVRPTPPPEGVKSVSFTKNTIAKISQNIPGFYFFVFSSHQKYLGFVEGLKLMRELDNDIGYNGEEIVPGLWGILVQSAKWSDFSWNDCRESTTEKTKEAQ
jgi:hypothetical protein